MVRGLIISLILAASAHAQILQGVMDVQPATGGGATPTLVNFSGMPNSETNALGAQPTTTCGSSAAKTACGTLIDASLAGNTIIWIYLYKPATGNTADVPTIATYLQNGSATGDTYTHCGTDANQSTNDYYLGCYYKVNATTGTKSAILTFANANTHVAVGAGQAYNLTAADVYTTNTGAAATTFTAGSATSTANSDFWVHVACGTSTVTNVGAYTLGSQAGITWVGDTFDRRDACGVQHGVQTTAGALNPQFTGASNNFLSLAIAFKSGSQGTAPSGMYVDNFYHVSSASGSSNLSYQFVMHGNLGVVALSGGSQNITAVSDSTNGSWTPCLSTPLDWNNTATSEEVTSGLYYIANATPGVVAVTLTVSGTGDIGPANFYDVVGAATTQQCGAATVITDQASTASTYTPVSGYVPSASSGIAFAATSQFFNTALGSGIGGQDCFTIGGQSVNGPSLPDQNNGCTHWMFSDNTSKNLVYTLADTGANAVRHNSTVIAAFQASGATLYPHAVKTAVHTATSGTSIAISSYAPYKSGDAIVGCATESGITSGTISVSDTVNGSWTSIDGPTNLSGWWTRCFYIKNISASTATITATVPTGSHNKSFTIIEYANANTTTPIDVHTGITAATTNGSGVASLTSGSTASANEGLFMFGLCQGTCDLNNAGFTGYINTPWSQVTSDGFGNIAGFWASGATGTVTASMTDSNGSGQADAIEIITVQ